MTRKFLTIILPMIAPAIVYITWAWFKWRLRKAQAKDATLPHWLELPWSSLVISGIALTVVTMITVAILAPEGTGVNGSAPRLEGGEIIPFSKNE